MVKDLLEKRIEELLEQLENTDKGSDEYKAVVSNVETLYKVENEANRIDLEKEKMYEDITLEVKKIQIDRQRNRIEIGKTLVTTASGIYLVKKILQVEEVAAVTTKAFPFVTSLFKVFR